MATVNVSYEDYVGGGLPDICMVSGLPTRDVFVYRVDVTSTAGAGRGRLAGSLDAALAAIDVRRPRRILVGRVPIDRTVQRSLVRRRRWWTATLVIALVASIVAAWAGAPWSPVVAPSAAAGAGLAAWQRHLTRTAFPRPSLTHDDARVTLDGVHTAFAAAVADRDPR